MCYTMVYKLTKMYTNDTWQKYAQEYIPLACKVKCKDMTLAICTLQKISPLHIKIQDYHLKSQCATLKII